MERDRLPSLHTPGTVSAGPGEWFCDTGDPRCVNMATREQHFPEAAALKLTGQRHRLGRKSPWQKGWVTHSEWHRDRHRENEDTDHCVKCLRECQEGRDRLTSPPLSSYMHDGTVTWEETLSSSQKALLIRTELKLLSDKKAKCQSRIVNVFFLFVGT